MLLKRIMRIVRYIIIISVSGMTKNEYLIRKLLL
jgi:hypothetical protein